MTLTSVGPLLPEVGMRLAKVILHNQQSRYGRRVRAMDKGYPIKMTLNLRRKITRGL